jgi:hypothetical protein
MLRESSSQKEKMRREPDNLQGRDQQSHPQRLYEKHPQEIFLGDDKVYSFTKVEGQYFEGIGIRLNTYTYDKKV